MTNSYIALSRKDVSAGVERKGNLDYLSWAYAWNALCEEHPDANFYFAADGTPQLYDFQYCGKACPAKDVAYCLCCGSSAWDDADALARGYHRDLASALAARGEEPPALDAFLLSLIHISEPTRPY